MAETKRPKSEKTSTARSVPPARADIEESGADSERWESVASGKAGSLNQTVRMDSAPSPGRAAPAPRSAGKSIELFVIDETQLPGGERKPWRAAEVWTKRRVYGLEGAMAG